MPHDSHVAADPSLHPSAGACRKSKPPPPPQQTVLNPIQRVGIEAQSPDKQHFVRSPLFPSPLGAAPLSSPSCARAALRQAFVKERDLFACEFVAPSLPDPPTARAQILSLKHNVLEHLRRVMLNTEAVGMVWLKAALVAHGLVHASTSRPSLPLPKGKLLVSTDSDECSLCVRLVCLPGRPRRRANCVFLLGAPGSQQRK